MITETNFVVGSQLTTSAVTYATMGANEKGTITSARLVNTTATPYTATVHVISAGATETAANRDISARTINPGETYKCPELIGAKMMATGTIRALAEANAAITFKVSGYIVTNG